MSKTVTSPWDPADHLKTEDDMVAYLEAALEEGDATLVASALGDIARAKGMSYIAREAGLGRESLYKALSPSDNPEFATIMKRRTGNAIARHIGNFQECGLPLAQPTRCFAPVRSNVSCINCQHQS
jgi:probable addiction module antidote protein